MGEGGDVNQLIHFFELVQGHMDMAEELGHIIAMSRESGLIIEEACFQR